MKCDDDGSATSHTLCDGAGCGHRVRRTACGQCGFGRLCGMGCAMVVDGLSARPVVVEATDLETLSPAHTPPGRPVPRRRTTPDRLDNEVASIGRRPGHSLSLGAADRGSAEMASRRPAAADQAGRTRAPPRAGADASRSDAHSTAVEDEGPAARRQRRISRRKVGPLRFVEVELRVVDRDVLPPLPRRHCVVNGSWTRRQCVT